MKADKNPMELVVKLLLNSLYGKFGQKFKDRENVIHKSQITPEMISADMRLSDISGTDYYSVKEEVAPSLFCIPIWAVYITAYARIKLYDYIAHSDPIYFDTDSIITKNEIPVSSELGEMKLESKLKKCVVVKPKFYFYVNDKDEFKSRIKGMPITFNSFDEAINFLNDPVSHVRAILKFKGALRRKKLPNEVIEFFKKVSLTDNKRIWAHGFDYRTSQDSKPKIVTEGSRSIL
jgi:hypothetical protein